MSYNIVTIMIIVTEGRKRSEGWALAQRNSVESEGEECP